ncbi:hypothetical protein [Vannielia sp.]|uniref:hypothetical protein n=1 Tax=Vannielia sp. TaxID=2813045 RepID=UPI00260C9F79|nr:hypothetical protein [Vannielia sp.]MDF1874103.1 hypothetical protein [Vannielia sp.]
MQFEWDILKRSLPQTPAGAREETVRAPVDEGWSFWVKWYDAALEGKALNPDMLEEIALIPSEAWEKGPAVVNPLIAVIVEKYDDETPDDLSRQLAGMEAAQRRTVEQVKAGMERNAKELPATFDALESLILLEIERLQKMNYENDAVMEEAKRQIGVLVTLYDTVQALRSKLPEDGPVSDEDAETSEKLLRLYGKKFAQLPREKIGEVVEGVWETGKGAVQFGLIGGSAYLAALYGVPIAAGVSVAALCFAPKKAGQIISAAKEHLPKPSP